MTDELEHRAEQIIDHLLAIPATQRLTAAQHVCGDNAPLLNRVQSLLSAAPTVDGFLVDATIDPPAEAIITEQPGTMIGRYKLLEQIGEGGFGIVFMAEQEKPVRRIVALKIIKLGMDTREVVARFEAERQALALMDHPNIARVLDAGATDTGRPYFVMELVRGSTITDYCDKHKMATADRVALLVQVCRAVQHAHGKGVIHRDLKPSNVLVTVTDDKPIPKVIDFGIAKATQAKLTDRTLFTGYRQLIGTPQYMSPEQADSDGSDIDTRTDVYSLGVLLYELLVGTTPHDPRALRSAAHEAMRKMIRESDPAKPSTRLNTLAGDTLNAVASNRGTDAKHLGQSLHGELDWIVMRALEKERSRRYETASAMAEDLARHLAGEAVAAGPPGGMYQFKKLLRRHRTAIVVASSIGVLLMLGIAGTTVGLVRETHQRRLAQIEKIEADKQRRSAQAVVDFLTQDLLDKASLDKGSAAVNHDKVVRDVLIKELLEPAIKTLDVRLHDEPTARAAVQVSIGHALRNLGRIDLALPLVQHALKTRQDLFGESDPNTMVAAREVAWDLGLLDRSNEAEPIARQSLDAGRRTLGEDHPDTVFAEQVYAVILLRLRRIQEAEGFAKQAYQGWVRLQGPEGDNVPEALTVYGETEVARGNFAAAIPLLKRQWEMLSQKRGIDNFLTLQALTFYCQALVMSGRLNEALPLMQTAVEQSHRVLGDDHIITLQAMGTYAQTLMELHQSAQAEPVLRQLDDIMRRSSPDNPLRGQVEVSFAQCLIANSKWADAESVLQENLAWDKTHSTPFTPAIADVQNLLNRCLQHGGKPIGPAATEPSSRANASDLTEHA